MKNARMFVEYEKRSIERQKNLRPTLWCTLQMCF